MVSGCNRCLLPDVVEPDLRAFPVCRATLPGGQFHQAKPAVTSPVDFPQELLLKVYMSNSDRTDLLQGTLDLLVLKTLAGLGPQHGFGIARRIEQVSGDTVLLN